MSGTRMYNLSVLGFMALYTALCFVVPELLTAMKVDEGAAGGLAALIGAAPSYPLAAVLVLYIRRLTELDEFQQKVQLLALAASTAVMLIGGTAYGFIILHLGYPEFPLFLIMPVYLVIWTVSGWFFKRRYM